MNLRLEALRRALVAAGREDTSMRPEILELRGGSQKASTSQLSSEPAVLRKAAGSTRTAENASPRPARAAGPPPDGGLQELAAWTADPRLVVSPDVDDGAREQYRRIAASLHQAQVEHDIRAILVTSALPGEGKTLTSVNLGLTLSASYGRRVLLVDADLRHPGARDILHVESTPGLSDALLNDRAVTPPQVSPRLWLLPAGTASADPMAALASEGMRDFVQRARENFDWVILDTPPIGVFADASLVVSHVDTALLVVAAGGTPVNLVVEAVDALGRERIFGTVLNRVAPRAVGYEYYRKYAAGASRR